jgi:hypothetical protein
MTSFKFLYRTAKGKIKNDINIEAPEREDAIAIFESDYPSYKWFETTQ